MNQYGCLTIIALLGTRQRIHGTKSSCLTMLPALSMLSLAIPLKQVFCISISSHLAAMALDYVGGHGLDLHGEDIAQHQCIWGEQLCEQVLS